MMTMTFRSSWRCSPAPMFAWHTLGRHVGQRAGPGSDLYLRNSLMCRLALCGQMNHHSACRGSAPRKLPVSRRQTSSMSSRSCRFGFFMSAELWSAARTQQHLCSGGSRTSWRRTCPTHQPGIASKTSPFMLACGVPAETSAQLSGPPWACAVAFVVIVMGLMNTCLGHLMSRQLAQSFPRRARLSTPRSWQRPTLLFRCARFKRVALKLLNRTWRPVLLALVTFDPSRRSGRRLFLQSTGLWPPATVCRLPGLSVHFPGMHSFRKWGTRWSSCLRSQPSLRGYGDGADGGGP